MTSALKVLCFLPLSAQNTVGLEPTGCKVGTTKIALWAVVTRKDGQQPSQL